MPDLMETPVVADTPVAVIETPEVSVAEHAAQFHPDAAPAKVDDGPDAVKRADDGKFQALSRKERRGYNARIIRQSDEIEALKRERDEFKAKVGTTGSVPAHSRTADNPTAAPVVSSSSAKAERYHPYGEAFDKLVAKGDPYPTVSLLQEAGLEDPYEALDEARREWRDRQTDSTTSKAQAQREVVEMRDTHHGRVAAFIAKTPDFVEKVKDWGTDATPLLTTAVMRHDNSAELVYHLAQHPDDYARLQLLTEGKAISAGSLKAVKDLLDPLRVSVAAPTTAASSPRAFVTPKPPTVVRTAATKTGDDPPADGHSIRDHKRHWGPAARR